MKGPLAIQSEQHQLWLSSTAMPGCADLQRAQFQRAEEDFVTLQDEIYGEVNVKIQRSPGKVRLARADIEPDYFKVHGK